LLGPIPTPKLEDYPLLTVHSCLFSIFTATLYIWRPSSRNLGMPPAVVTAIHLPFACHKRKIAVYVWCHLQ